MNILYSEIKKLANIPDSVSAHEFGEKLTIHTVEVDDVRPLAPECVGFVVGVITSIAPHPDADRLKIAMVDHGVGAPAQVVCGGVNIYEGMYVVFARSGARVRWHGEGEPVVLQPAAVRGVMSDGMICSAGEVGLGHLMPHGEKEVVDLTQWGGQPGDDVATVLQLDDYCIEVDNKSITNRPDLWGYWGIAREASAIFGTQLALPEVHSVEVGPADIAFDVQTDQCLAYAGATARYAPGTPTPWSMIKVLAISDIVPRHPVVDRANYAMLMTGQPFHAFDRDKVGEDITVRRADKADAFVGLDAIPRLLAGSDIVIANKKHILALAGVIGGQESAVTDTTTRIVIESAVFDGLAIRKTSQRNALRTDASARYEKRLDPTRTEQNLHYLIELLRDVVEVGSIGITHVVQPSFREDVIEVSASKIHAMLGFFIDHARVETILTSLGFGVAHDDAHESFAVTVPSWRATGDITSPEDVVEEIARMYGYAHIQGVTVDASALGGDMKRMHTSTDARNTAYAVARQLFVGAYAAHECIGYPFLHENDRKKYLTEQAEENLVRLKNVINEEERYLRPTQIFGLMHTAKERVKSGVRSGILFELGHVFHKEGGVYDIGGEDRGVLCAQPSMLTLVGWGHEHWFEYVKGMVSGYMRALEKDESAIIWCGEDAGDVTVFGAGAVVGKTSDGGVVCTLGSIATKDAGARGPNFFALEFNVDGLTALPSVSWTYRLPHAYPLISLDETIQCSGDVSWGLIHEAIRVFQAENQQADIRIYDVKFIGWVSADAQSASAPTVKSITYRLEIGSPTRTLQKQEALTVQKQVLERLMERFESVSRGVRADDKTLGGEV